MTFNEILAFYDTSIADGSLFGKGSGGSKQKRLDALRDMIEAAKYMESGGDTAGAIEQLNDVATWCDGLASPVDFVEGPSTATLNTKVDQMIIDLTP